MNRIGYPTVFLESVESTNNYLADHLEVESVAEGTAILTYDQSAGRGQFSNRWAMQPTKDLAVSFLLRPEVSPKDLFLLNKALALAVREAVESFALGKVQVKWPNDVYLSGKKVAGLLVEPTWAGGACRHVIVGIGVNVNGTCDEYPFQAISIAESRGGEVDLEVFFHEMCDQLSKQYKLFLGDNAAQIHSSYDSHLLGRGKLLEIDVKKEGLQRMEILGVDEMGRLACKQGERLRAFLHGEVTVDYFSH